MSISLSQVQENFPTFCNTHAHDSRSDKYQQVTTFDVLQDVVPQGYEIANIDVAKTRKAETQGYQRHVVRLRNADYNETSDFVPEIIIVNSHNGTSSFQVYTGFHVFACSNGLVAGDIGYSKFVRHIGSTVVYDVANAIYAAMRNVNEPLNAIERMKRKILSYEEKKNFVLMAIAARYGDDYLHQGYNDYVTNRMLQVNRRADNGDDMWRVFNTVQEKLINGSYVVLPKDTPEHRAKRAKIRKLSSIDAKVQLNRDLWDLAIAA
jgi:hypothetical protein